MNEYIIKLKSKSIVLGKDVESISKWVLDDPKFGVWTGSIDNKHHYGFGGLSEHTFEVVQLCFSNKETLNIDVDDKELFFAALFHDVGKLYDYLPVEGSDFKEWVGAPHKRLIHHISRSALIWSHAVEENKELKEKYHDSVLHAILSHHGCRAWGSPVSPKTKLAYLLHLCDAISARINDCDRVDLIK